MFASSAARRIRNLYVSPSLPLRRHVKSDRAALAFGIESSIHNDYARDALGFSHTHDGSFHYQIETPARGTELVEMNPPITADGSVHPVYRGAQFYRYPSLFLAHVRNGRLLGREGVVMTTEGLVLEESSFAWGMQPRQWPVFRRLSVPAVKEKMGAMLTLLSPVAGKP